MKIKFQHINPWETHQAISKNHSNWVAIKEHFSIRYTDYSERFPQTSGRAPKLNSSCTQLQTSAACCPHWKDRTTALHVDHPCYSGFQEPLCYSSHSVCSALRDSQWSQLGTSTSKHGKAGRVCIHSTQVADSGPYYCSRFPEQSGSFIHSQHPFTQKLFGVWEWVAHSLCKAAIRRRQLIKILQDTHFRAWGAGSG